MAPPGARPLSGLRVLDLSRLLPGPFLTMVLTDLGADVVKVEDPRLGDYLRTMPPGKDGVGGRFLAVNRDKRSIAVDLKAPAQREVFLALAAKADVVVESFRPGVLAKLGVGWDVLHARNPRLVLCSLSGYGQTGPMRDRAGHDLNYVGLAGVLAMTGLAGGAPVMPGAQIADMASGLWGAIGVLGALVGRERGQEGRWLDVSMTESALSLLAAELGNLPFGARPTRGAELLNGGVACYGVYGTRDGKHLTVAGLEPKFWLAFNQAIGRTADPSDLIAPPARQAEIRADVQARLLTKTRAEWEAIFATVDAACEPVLEPDELAAHPLHAARQVFYGVPHPVIGESVQVRTPVGEPHARSTGPKLGEHTREVVLEWGLVDADATALGA